MNKFIIASLFIFACITSLKGMNQEENIVCMEKMRRAAFPFLYEKVEREKQSQCPEVADTEVSIMEKMRKSAFKFLYEKEEN